MRLIAPRSRPIVMRHFTSPPKPEPKEPAPVVAEDQTRLVLPPGPARIQFRWRLPRDPSVVDVTRAPWSSPFRIQEADPEDRQGPCTIVWGPRGAGVLRTPPPDFEPIPCVSRREAQELILILYAEWLADPLRLQLWERIRAELQGKLLACLCNPRTPCHGDVLLNIANSEAS